MKRCPKCGYRLDRGTEKYCPDCAEKLEERLSGYVMNAPPPRSNAPGPGLFKNAPPPRSMRKTRRRISKK